MLTGSLGTSLSTTGRQAKPRKLLVDGTTGRRPHGHTAGPAEPVALRLYEYHLRARRVVVIIVVAAAADDDAIACSNNYCSADACAGLVLTSFTVFHNRPDEFTRLKDSSVTPACAL
ncbi:unnamed protein product [Heligmosomoides polygyrus]|uniref:Uncharacterized protein n=1 Tax=Heligmosomoides polygyrus TaxID=6339 RepID=A0A183FKH7_HELPZ|nr:unnamed protein product [Heligmosomoides polygyrus]